jgi:hypothetical protein
VDKKFRLPKDEFIDGQDVEGHGRPTESSGDERPARTGGPDRARLHDTDGEDVEGHRRPVELTGDDLTILPSPPSLGLSRTPGHGGELTRPEDSDRT